MGLSLGQHYHFIGHSIKDNADLFWAYWNTEGSKKFRVAIKLTGALYQYKLKIIKSVVQYWPPALCGRVLQCLVFLGTTYRVICYQLLLLTINLDCFRMQNLA